MINLSSRPNKRDSFIVPNGGKKSEREPSGRLEDFCVWLRKTSSLVNWTD